jgi:hypothetical protein
VLQRHPSLARVDQLVEAIALLVSETFDQQKSPAGDVQHVSGEELGVIAR